jgi:GntR family transcriptional regulator, rspAB operon transcriptional repressor
MDSVSAPASELSTRVVHDRLRASILRGEFDSDSPISQVQLAARLGVSRTPLREALRMLEREGLIDSEPNRRVRVAQLTVADLEQLYAARIVIESLGARLAVPVLSAADLADMRRMLGQMTEVKDHDLAAWDVWHRAFHDLLKNRYGDRLSRTARDLFDYTERYRHVYLTEPHALVTVEQDHRAIFESCQAGDALAASVHLARHTARAALTVIALAEPEHDPVPVREALRMVTGVSEEAAKVADTPAVTDGVEGITPAHPV